jgi:hypothetical protein
LAKLEQFKAPAECEGHMLPWGRCQSLNEIEKVLVAHTTLWCFVLFPSTSDSSEIKPKFIRSCTCIMQAILHKENFCSRKNHLNDTE